MILSRSFKLILLTQLFCSMVLTLGGFFYGDLQLGASIGTGALLIFGSLVMHGWIWYRLLEKKSIAWTLPIIVIKYAVLLGAILLLLRTHWFSVLGAGIGISSLALSALVYAILENRIR